LIEDFNYNSGYASVNGAKIYYEIAGEGYPLILLHAGIADSRMWDAQFRSFAQDNLVVRYDMRGFGKTKLVRGEFSPVEDLAALMDTLGIEAAVLLGVSMGGSVALDFTLTHPDRVDGLIVAASAASGHQWSNLALEKWGEIDEVMERGDKEKGLELELRMWVDGPTRKPDQVDAAVRAKVAEMLAPTYDIEQGIAKEKGIDPPAMQRLAEIDVPVLVMVGDADMPDMMTIADKLVQGIGGARKVVIPGAHMINMEQPQKFNRAVRQFLEQIS
jgi:3-oxoadipate enol-lactonase